MSNVNLTVNLTPEAAAALEEIAALTGGNRAQALNQALTAYADAPIWGSGELAEVPDGR